MSSSELQQAQAEGLCLHFPESMGSTQTVNFDLAVNTLSKAANLALDTPFAWRYIDKPQEGQLAILFLPPGTRFPNDGIRYQEPETTMTMHVGPSHNRTELEVCEAKSGFIPGSQDQHAWRLRRRFRLLRIGHPNLVLVHYTRGPNNPISPTVATQPVRKYPLRTISEPPTYVLGEKAGHKVLAPGSSSSPQAQPPSNLMNPHGHPAGVPGGMHPAGPTPALNSMNMNNVGGISVGGGMSGGGMGGIPGGPNMGGAPGGMGGNPVGMGAGPGGMGVPGGGVGAAHSQAAMINHQTAQMEQLQQRREREMGKERHHAQQVQAQAMRERERGGHGRVPLMDDGSDDETEQISTRNLALARYRRNHDLMQEVFTQAAFSEKDRKARPTPYSIFNKEDLERKTAHLQAEIEALQKKGSERRAARGGDVSMGQAVASAA